MFSLGFLLLVISSATFLLYKLLGPEPGATRFPAQSVWFTCTSSAFPFLTGWIADLNRIEHTQQEAITRKTNDLPDWILIAQQLKAS